jgi:vacuolar-type H+-ATPase subunit H
MADLLEAADRQALKLGREAEEEAGKLVADARQEADQIRREAEVEAERHREQGRDELGQARAEAHRLLGTMTERRDALLADLAAMREHILELVTMIDSATNASAGWPLDPVDMVTEPETSDPAVQVGDLLVTLEGFDLFGNDAEQEEQSGREG